VLLCYCASRWRSLIRILFLWLGLQLQLV
jgi:hypothetical protein